MSDFTTENLQVKCIMKRISVSERNKLIGAPVEKTFYYQDDNMFEVHRDGRVFKMTPKEFGEYKRFMKHE